MVGRGLGEGAVRGRGRAPGSIASETVGCRAGLLTAQIQMHPLFFHPEKMCGLTCVVLGQVVTHLPNLFLIHKEKRKSRAAEEKQPRKS